MGRKTTVDISNDKQVKSLSRRPTREGESLLVVLSQPTIHTHTHAETLVNTIKTCGHSSLEKYTSHFIRNGYERVYV